MIVDANILLYATDETSDFHPAAKAWLEDALNGPARVGLPWATLTAFLRIATHPRAARHPLSARQAWDLMTDWLDSGPVWIPQPGPRHLDVFRRLTIDGALQGNLITDAHLAALAIEHGVGVCSADSDFARFPELDWVSPLR
ncbi:MAG: PIN domain-containing protein [Nocardiopsaceae bacterium]|nr:PIN domain-containing protein [Nocardiopsaceae bacterium]